MNAYERELKIHRDIYSANEYLINKGELKGGHDKAISIALEMQKMGITNDVIIKATKLSAEEVDKL